MEIHIQTPLSLILLLPFFFFTFLPLSSQACHQVDRDALLDFKHSINPLNLLQSWIPSTDCCSTWDGIACDPSSGRVVQVSLPVLSDKVCSMNVTLSPSLGNLSFLQFLDLSDLNRLSGPIPPELGKLSRLSYLYLSNNCLSGEIPVSLGRLTRLKILHLSWNLLSGSVPSALFHSMPLLYDLDLSYNNLFGVIPSSIGKLISLINLELQSNRFYFC
ncbi:unnamed protein product [Thlaspi arvense]|uniref:Leucine-rich repeat-containing N-terminal plant-type domain-containing protein n=1 Tax=Thlaspi arvense TaxID=13288 RepID=A0AAU9RS65_THLAR|nr:unnamed protein product [Thlaspi arvense]